MATQITASLPTLNFPKEVDYPTQEDWAAFSAAAEENFGILGGSWSTQMQLWKTEANAMSTELNNNSNIAQSVANYQGDWVSQGYTLGQSVSVNGIYYVCKLTHATGQNPTAGGSLYWNLVIGNWDLKADKTETNTINNQLNTHVSLSGVTAYHLLGGNLSIDNTVLTNGFGLYLYTGNATTLPTINLGMDITSQWGNTADETYGYLIKIKSRSAIGDWTWVNSVRGITKYISSNTTAVEGTDANMFTLSTVAGVTTLNIGTSTRTNTNGVTYVVEVYQTTHKKTGVTNQGKTFTEHYNPDTGFTIEGYEGSGLAGHELPHSLGRELGLVIVKNLVSIQSHIVSQNYDYNNVLALNSTNQLLSNATKIYINSTSESYVTVGGDITVNTSANQYIMFGWRNSYFDESGKLLGNFELGVYQGTGVAGNKVTTRGKLALLMPKRLDSTGSWGTLDVKRNEISGANDGSLFLNLADAEVSTANLVSFVADGVILNNNSGETNVSGGQYLYFGVYDNDSGSGKSKYYKATDTANVQVNNGIIPLAHGIDSNGSKNSIVVSNETITGVTYTGGKNYLYKTDTGYGVKPYEPRYLASELVRRFAGEQPDYYDVESNKWFNCDAGVELVTNGDGTSTVGWTNGTGATISTENGRLKLVTTANTSAYQSLSLIAGKTYRIKGQVQGNGTLQAQVMINNETTIVTNGTFFYSDVNSSSFNSTFVATENTTKIHLRFTGAGTGYFDGISVFPVDIVPTTEITESRNYMNHIVHADTDGGVLYVEELPKIEYKNVIKAEEYLGSQIIIGRARINPATTPPTIIDYDENINGIIKGVVRTATGVCEVYIDNQDNNSYSVMCSTVGGASAGADTFTNSKFKVYTVAISPYSLSNIEFTVTIFGGRN